MAEQEATKKHAARFAAWMLAVIMAVAAVIAAPQEIYAAGQQAKAVTSMKTAVKTAKKKITLTKTKATLYAGEYTTIKVKKVTGLASEKVTYQSGNKKIAVVSKSGVVTAKKKGTVTIKVISAVDKKVKATFKLTVKAKAKKSSITLANTKAKLAVGGSTKIKVKELNGTSSKDVTYTSSNKKVATVSKKGTVKAKGKGSATITVTSAVNKKVKAKFKVTVTQPATDIAVPEEIVLQLTEGMKLSNITVYPTDANNKNYTIKSDNTSIAHITKDDDGYGVLAVGVGKTTLTVQTADKKITKKIKVTVKQKVVKAEGVAFKDIYGGSYIGFRLPKGQSYKIQAYVWPENATCKKMFWSSSDTSVATVDQNGVVTHVSPGNCVITVSTCDGTGTTQKYGTQKIHLWAEEDPVMKWKDAVRYMQKHEEKEKLWFYMTKEDYKTLYDYVKKYGTEENIKDMKIEDWFHDTRRSCGFESMLIYREEGKLLIKGFEIPEDFK